MLLKDHDDQRYFDQRAEEHLLRAGAGKMEEDERRLPRQNKHLMQIIDRIISKVGRRVDETCPMVDARMMDGLAFQTRSFPAAGARMARAFRFADSAPIR